MIVENIAGMEVNLETSGKNMDDNLDELVKYCYQHYHKNNRDTTWRYRGWSHLGEQNPVTRNGCNKDGITRDCSILCDSCGAMSNNSWCHVCSNNMTENHSKAIAIVQPSVHVDHSTTDKTTAIITIENVNSTPIVNTFTPSSPTVTQLTRSPTLIKKSPSPILTNLTSSHVSWVKCTFSSCSFLTMKPSRLSRHLLFHVSPGDRFYQCPDCKFRFYSLHKALKHDRRIHTGVKEWECQVCLAEVTDLQVHMKVGTIFISN